MHPDLAAIKDAMDPGTGDGRDADKARSLADTYVAAHPAEFDDLRELSIEDCVKAVDTFRASGMDEWEQRVETWLLHRFEPQNIGGVAKAAVRIPING